MSTPRIQQLDVSVVNKIAAGEVIQRPANAFKELLENALDAGSSNIRVTIKEGGLKLLQIQDDGHGIQQEDMALACQRFSTSKLRTYEDLTHINTFGFRGEALASISHVAHVTIISKTKDAPCAFKGIYRDGKLLGDGPNSTGKVTPCSGNDGTSITVEDLFYTMPNRRRALRSVSEEYNRLLAVAQQYAIHNAGVSISVKKHGQNRSDLQTMNNYSSIDCIRHVYGNSIANELVEVCGKDEALQAELTGHVTNANYTQRKLVLLLFINDRAVESNALRRAVETVYQEFLSKGGRPFVYLSLKLPSNHVDVNVHPTKQEVHFLYEDAVATFLVDQLTSTLNSVNKSRTFLTQTLLPVTMISPKQVISTEITHGSKDKVRDPHLVRTDSHSQTLRKFYRSASASSPMGSFESVIENEIDNTTTANENDTLKHINTDNTDNGSDNNVKNNPVTNLARIDNEPIMNERPVKRPRTDVRLISVLELREEIEQDLHHGLTEIIAGHIFVGFVDDERILIQHDTRLYVMELNRISRVFFYQAILREFCNFGRIELTPPANIRDLIQLAVRHEMNYVDANQLRTPDEIANDVTELLIERRAMLLEYFGLDISSEGELQSIPLILRGYTPELCRLPAFLLRLGFEVDWTEEKPCLEGIASELATFYALTPPSYYTLSNDDRLLAREKYRSIVEHLLLPAFKSSIIIPNTLVEQQCVVQIAHLPDLYRIFERC
ncbi:putative DNA mismatch repair protein mlh1 [Syncephalis plumigaleata]|nr:putative DNA mismatch repair protein mlh1 [Syncephalis plumigaleata]